MKLLDWIFGKNVIKHEIYIGLTHKNGVCVLDRAVVIAAIAKAIGDCSITDQIGIYKGARENSLCVVVFSEKRDYSRLETAAAKLCEELYQECIIVDGNFVTARG